MFNNKFIFNSLSHQVLKFFTITTAAVVLSILPTHAYSQQAGDLGEGSIVNGSLTPAPGYSPNTATVGFDTANFFGQSGSTTFFTGLFGASSVNSTSGQLQLDINTYSGPPTGTISPTVTLSGIQLYRGNTITGATLYSDTGLAPYASVTTGANSVTATITNMPAAGPGGAYWNLSTTNNAGYNLINGSNSIGATMTAGSTTTTLGPTSGPPPVVVSSNTALWAANLGGGNTFMYLTGGDGGVGNVLNGLPTIDIFSSASASGPVSFTIYGIQLIPDVVGPNGIIIGLVSGNLGLESQLSSFSFTNNSVTLNFASFNPGGGLSGEFGLLVAPAVVGVPEPSAYMLLGSCLLIALLFEKRRRRAFSK